MNLNIDGKNILLVDFNNLIARTYYAFNTTTTTGIHSGLFFGTLKLLINKISKHNIDKVIVCMDRRPYWRSLILPEYKATRKGFADSLGDNYESFKEQSEDIQLCLGHIDFDIMSFRSFEADDLISALVYRYKNNNNIFIYSGDHDFLQLVQNNVNFVRPKANGNDLIYTNDNFKEMVGVTQETYLQTLIFAGDSGDEVPSVFAVKNGTQEEGYYWEEPKRVFSENKAMAILSVNKVENLLEGKINPVKGIGQKTYDLFLKADKSTLLKNYERNKKLVDLTNGKDKFEAILNVQNDFTQKEVKISVITHLFSKYECNSLKIISTWPYITDRSSAQSEVPKINKNNFASLLSRVKKSS